jgi:phosphomannomutase
MVTASHNPKQFNGFKLCRKNGFPISQKNGIKDIQKLVEKKFKDKKKGVVVKKNCMDFYIKYCLKFVHGSPKLKIVLDAGNGMCGYTFPKIFRGIEAELVELYTKLDFTFPHHEPNPLKYQTLKDLQRKVVKEKANFGVATDGDGDRCVFIDEKGEIITADLVLALIAEYILRKNHGAAIMYDVRCSKIVKETIEANGGKAIMSRVGHSFIKEQMRREKVIFAGELSGHFYYKENNYAESSFITTAMMMNLVSKKKLSQLVEPLRKYFHTGEINLKIKDKIGAMSKTEKAFKGKVVRKDGLSMYFKDWWFNLRPSNTEDLLRLNLEADSKELMEEKKKGLLELIK